MFKLTGTPSDEVPGILACGSTDIRRVFISMSEREESGRDADYFAWHSMDHRPEQYRLDGIRQTIRLVSTPECRAARAISHPPYDAVDHVMTYFFTEDAAFDQYRVLSNELMGERRPFRLPPVSTAYYGLAGKIAAPEAIAGADVIPWRPARGIYIIVEEGELTSPAALVDVPGVAGIWWFQGGAPPVTEFPDNSGLLVTYCFLDEDPVETAGKINEALNLRWSNKAIEPLFAAPFHVLVPFEWERYLP